MLVEGSLVSAHLDWMGGGGSGGACLEELNTDCLGTHKPFCLPSWSRRTRFWESLSNGKFFISIQFESGPIFYAPVKRR